MAAYKKITFLLFFACCFFIKSRCEFQCSDGPPGQYCTDDLSGYHDCSVTGIDNVIKCPANTRCTCFLRNKCRVDQSQICATFTQAPKMIETFVLHYHGFNTVLSPAGKTSNHIQGLIRQDKQKGKFKLEHWEGTIYSFQYVIPNNDGTFTKVRKFLYFANTIKTDLLSSTLNG